MIVKAIVTQPDGIGFSVVDFDMRAFFISMFVGALITNLTPTVSTGVQKFLTP